MGKFPHEFSYQKNFLLYQNLQGLAWSNEFIWCIEDELKNLYTQNLVCVMQTLIFHLEIFINLLKFSTM